MAYYDDQMLKAVQGIDRSLKRIAQALEDDQQGPAPYVLIDHNGIQFIPVQASANQPSEDEDRVIH